MKFSVSVQPHVFLMHYLAHQCPTNMLTSRSLQETLWENMWEWTNCHSLTLSYFLSPCSDKSWNVASLFFCVCFLLSCLFTLGRSLWLFPRPGWDESGCFRGAKSRLRPLSYAQTSTQKKKQRMTHNHINPFTKAIMTSFWTANLSRSAHLFKQIKW